MSLKKYIAAGLVTATALYMPSANAGLLKEVGKRIKNTVKETVETVIEIPLVIPRVIEGAVKEKNPIDGVRKTLVNSLESVIKEIPTAVVTGEATKRLPHEMGKANNYIEERPALKAVTNIATAGLTAYGIGEAVNSIPRHINQAVGYSIAGQGAIEAANASSE